MSGNVPNSVRRRKGKQGVGGGEKERGRIIQETLTRAHSENMMGLGFSLQIVVHIGLSS